MNVRLLNFLLSAGFVLIVGCSYFVSNFTILTIVAVLTGVLGGQINVCNVSNKPKIQITVFGYLLNFHLIRICIIKKIGLSVKTVFNVASELCTTQLISVTKLLRNTNKLVNNLPLGCSFIRMESEEEWSCEWYYGLLYGNVGASWFCHVFCCHKPLQQRVSVCART